MDKLGQIKSGTMRVGNTTSTGYGIIYADEIIGHRRANSLYDLTRLPIWCLYDRAGGEDAEYAIGQLWYASKAYSTPNNSATFPPGLYQLVKADHTQLSSWKLFKNGADIVDTNTTYSLSGSDATVKLTGSDSEVTSFTVNNVAHANTATKADQAISDENGKNIANTYVTNTNAAAVYLSQKDAINTYATKTDVASLTSALVYKGTVNATHALPTKDVKVGDVYVVAAAGTYAGQMCENGDMIIASSVTPTWTVVQANINGAVTATNTLTDNAIVLGSSNRSVKTFATTSTAGYLYWTGSAYTWKTPAEFSLTAANTNSLGGIKIGYTATGKNYPVQLDSNNKAYVNVPWTDTDTKYTLPIASDSVLGGIKTGYKGSTALNIPIYVDRSTGKAYAGAVGGIANEILEQGEGVLFKGINQDTNNGLVISLNKASTKTLGGVKATPTAETPYNAVGDIVSDDYYQVNAASINPDGILLYLQAKIERISDATIINTFKQ